MLLGKTLGTFRHEVNVRAFTQHLTGGANRIRDVLHASDSACAKRGAVHDEGIELNLTLSVKETAAARVKSLVIFHYDDSGLNRVKR